MEITDVLERMDDGRMNILTRGTRPFRIIDERDDLAYPAGTVEFLDRQVRAPPTPGRRRPPTRPMARSWCTRPTASPTPRS